MKKNYSTVTYKAEPDPLEAHGGKVASQDYRYFPGRLFQSKGRLSMLSLTLFVKAIEIPLKPILLKGTDVGGEGIVISEDGGSFTYETVVDYNESCRVS